jgi:hypothetical protein
MTESGYSELTFSTRMRNIYDLGTKESAPHFYSKGYRNDIERKTVST